MALKTYRPTTPGLRQLVLVDRSNLWKGDPIESVWKQTGELGWL